MNSARSQALNAAFLSLPAPAALLDAMFQFIAVNKSFTTQFEYTDGEIIGRKAEFLYEASLHEVELNTQQWISCSASPDFALQRVIRTRSARLLDVTVCIRGLPGISPPQYVVLFQNITSAHDKERVLLSRSEMFRLMVERSPLPISVQDQDWRLILVNQAYCDFTGYERAELIGKDPAAFLHPPEQVTHLPAQRKALLNLNVVEFPNHQVIREFVRRDGTRARYSGSLGFTRGPAGESLWCATLVDLTALDKLRSELTEQSDLAGAMQARFDRFSALSEDGIAIVQREANRVVYANQALSKLLNLDRTLLIGAPLSSLWEKFHPEDIKKVNDAVTTSSPGSQFDVTLRMRFDSGNERWIRLRSVCGGEKQPEFFLVFEDISESIERQEAREREAAAQIEAVVSEVHHRIKNHLQGVLGLLSQRDDVDPKSNAMVAKAAAQIAGIAEVHGILMNSLTATTLDSMVIAITRAAERLWNVPIELKSIQDSGAAVFSISEKESVPLALILNELILNAIKHRSGQGSISVVIKAGAQSVSIQLINAGTLPPDFDLIARPSNSGLGLVRSLYARTSTRLTLSVAQDQVVAELALSAPVVLIATRAERA